MEDVDAPSPIAMSYLEQARTYIALCHRTREEPSTGVLFAGLGEGGRARPKPRISGMRSQISLEPTPCVGRRLEQKLIGSQIFCDSHLPWAHIATASAVTAVHGAIWSPQINTWKESAKSTHPDSKWPANRERLWPTAPSTPSWCSTLGERRPSCAPKNTSGG